MRFVISKPLGLATALCFASRPLFICDKTERMCFDLMVWERVVVSFKYLYNNLILTTRLAFGTDLQGHYFHMWDLASP